MIPGESAPPEPPADIAVEAMPGAVGLLFEAPANNGSPIQHYTVEARDRLGTVCSVQVAAETATASAASRRLSRQIASRGSSRPASRQSIARRPSTSQPLLQAIIVDNLPAGKPVSFIVTSTNEAGTSLPSFPTLECVPQGPPRAPAHLTWEPASGGVKLRFEVPSHNGSPLQLYTATVLRASGDGPPLLTVPTAVESVSPAGMGYAGIALDGLPVGETVTVTLTASNDLGAGAPSRPTTPFLVQGPPQTPGPVTVDPGPGGGILHFLAPVANGSPVQHYAINVIDSAGAVILQTQKRGKHNLQAGRVAVPVDGLPAAETVTLTVAAVNAWGQSEYSAPTPQLVVPAATKDALPTASLKKTWLKAVDPELKSLAQGVGPQYTEEELEELLEAQRSHARMQSETMALEQELHREKEVLAERERELAWEKEKSTLRTLESDRELERQRLLDLDLEIARERARHAHEERERAEQWAQEQAQRHEREQRLRQEAEQERARREAAVMKRKADQARSVQEMEVQEQEGRLLMLNVEQDCRQGLLLTGRVQSAETTGRISLLGFEMYERQQIMQAYDSVQKVRHTQQEVERLQTDRRHFLAFLQQAEWQDVVNLHRLLKEEQEVRTKLSAEEAHLRKATTDSGQATLRAVEELLRQREEVEAVRQEHKGQALRAQMEMDLLMRLNALQIDEVGQRKIIQNEQAELMLEVSNAERAGWRQLSAGLMPTPAEQIMQQEAIMVARAKAELEAKARQDAQDEAEAKAYRAMKDAETAVQVQDAETERQRKAQDASMAREAEEQRLREEEAAKQAAEQERQQKAREKAVEEETARLQREELRKALTQPKLSDSLPQAELGLERLLEAHYRTPGLTLDGPMALVWHCRARGTPDPIVDLTAMQQTPITLGELVRFRTQFYELLDQTDQVSALQCLSAADMRAAGFRLGLPLLARFVQELDPRGQCLYDLWAFLAMRVHIQRQLPIPIFDWWSFVGQTMHQETSYVDSDGRTVRLSLPQRCPISRYAVAAALRAMASMPHPDLDCDDDDEGAGHSVPEDDDSAPPLQKSVQIDAVPRRLATPDKVPAAASLLKKIDISGYSAKDNHPSLASAVPDVDIEDPVYCFHEFRHISNDASLLPFLIGSAHAHTPADMQGLYSFQQQQNGMEIPSWC
uniref:Fibronectin type-III domain-containing protein n=1 Tax=Eutreptiella gymnastica TaxID=73025 RepID=A0A7S1I9M3_9EUGL